LYKHHRSTPENSFIRRSVETRHMYDRILLSTDGTVASEEAESHAVELAAAHGATLHTLYVVDEDVVTAYSGDEYVDEAEGPEHGLEEQGEETLSRLESHAAAAGVEFVGAMETGQPAETVADYAEDNDVDLVVLGTKHRAEEYRSLLGSVTDRVLRLTARPVTVVKTEIED
jgi:nucleotide-binding universal stress UspA family protein